MTKLFSPEIQSVSVGPCEHEVVAGVIEACSKCEKTLRRWGFIAYRGQSRPEPVAAKEVPVSFNKGAVPAPDEEEEEED